MAARRAIMVTGGNDGIGLALCKQLAAEDGCKVFMGSRSLERGMAALKKIETDGVSPGTVEVVQCDVCDADSIKAAVATVEVGLAGGKLYGLVNNAGVGFMIAASEDVVLDTNLYGAKRVTEAFGKLLAADGRLVNVGSGGGPGYVSKIADPTLKTAMCRAPQSWNEIEGWLAAGKGSAADSNGGYGLSKALLTSYTMLVAAEHPEWICSCTTPGWIKTKLTGGPESAATKLPEEGTVSIRHCLFGELEGSGWYYGSDAKRSPLHFMRSPGEPVYDGVAPTF